MERVEAGATLGSADEAWMRVALGEARAGVGHDDVPVGAVVLGPGGAGAHADEEWVDLDDVDRCAQIYLDTARRLCA
jgi:acetylornithine deacetylase/succinyl-diaminopimelate desuccinylase-like protein